MVIPLVWRFFRECGVCEEVRKFILNCVNTNPIFKAASSSCTLGFKSSSQVTVLLVSTLLLLSIVLINHRLLIIKVLEVNLDLHSCSLL